MPAITPLFPPAAASAVAKFYELNDDLDATQAVYRRVFFEFLRTRPSLSVTEIDNLWSVAELLHDLNRCSR